MSISQGFRTALAAIAALGCCVSVAAANLVSLEGAAEAGFDVAPAISILKDEAGTLDVQSAWARRADFMPGSPRIGRTTSAIWLQFKVQPPAGTKRTWYLDSGSRTLHEADVYVLDAQGATLWHQATSAAVPFTSRPVAADSLVLSLPLGPEPATVLLRVRTRSWIGIALAPRIWEPAAFAAHEAGQRNQWLIYIGMAAALGLFNLVLFVALRDVNYLLYVLSLVSVVWAVSSVYGGMGSAYALLWPQTPAFEEFAWLFTLVIGVYGPITFINRLLRVRATMPSAYWMLHAFLAGFAVTTVPRMVARFLEIDSMAGSMQMLSLVGSLAYFGIMGTAAFLLIRLTAKGHRQAKLILVAWMPMILAVCYSSTQTIRGEPFHQVVLMWASAFELVMMALVLADRFNQERTEKLQAQDAVVQSLRDSERVLEQRVLDRTAELAQEQARTQALLHNILPVEVAAELTRTGRARPSRHESASILFTDFRGFTQAVGTMPADRMVSELNEIFSAFDDIADRCGVEKIKTIGDAYMAAAGVPTACEDHAMRCVAAGLEMLRYIASRNTTSAFKWELRVGVHSGPVVSGVVGSRKYAFDIWGDAVNIASRMESAGAPGRVNISAYTYELVRSRFECEYRGKVEAKGKGEIDMYFVKGEIAAGRSERLQSSAAE